MSINELSIQEKMDLAYSSNDNNLLDELSKDVSVKVRRLLAKNKNATSNILNTLAQDPVMNVSYMAVLNPNCSFSREFEEEIHPCVECTKDERTMNCLGCMKL